MRGWVTRHKQSLFQHLKGLVGVMLECMVLRRKLMQTLWSSMVHGVHGTFTQLPRNHQHVGSPSLKQGIWKTILGNILRTICTCKHYCTCTFIHIFNMCICIYVYNVYNCIYAKDIYMKIALHMDSAYYNIYIYIYYIKVKYNITSEILRII